MAGKKKYKGTVIDEFKVGYKDGIKTFRVGDIFETTNRKSLQHLINIKKLK
jgi:hypothetical protein